MRKLQSKFDQEEVRANWLTTFNDLMTLLMVFFVLLFTMGSVDTKKLTTFKGSLQSGLGVLKEGDMIEVGVINPENISESMPEKQGVKPDDIKESTFNRLHAINGVKLKETKKGMVIILEDTILFKSGRADVGVEAVTIIKKIAEILNSTSGSICVEGHTDDVPINSTRFHSNWELSTARAVNVVKYFVEEGKILPKRLSAVGYGDVKALFPNDSKYNKARNRRVEIILEMKEGY